MRSDPECDECDQTLSPASLDGGGLVAWFCEGCETLFPAYEGQLTTSTVKRRDP